MTHKPLQVSIAIVMIVASLVLGYYIGAARSALHSKRAATNLPLIGQPCDYKDAPIIDTKGLQCYWYGKAPDRHAIWIQPDLRYPENDPYSDFTVGWKTVSSPDGSFSFEIPPYGSVDTQGWSNRDKRLFVKLDRSSDFGTHLTIRRVGGTEADIEKAVQEDTASGVSQYLRSDIEINGVQAIRLDTWPDTSLADGLMEIFIPRQTHYILVACATIRCPIL